MTHLTETFPYKLSYGCSRRTQYRTSVISAASGRTERNSRWDYPLHTFGVPITNRRNSELELLIEYWHAAAGRSSTFNFQDPLEYKSCATDESPSATDQTLDTAVNGQKDFQVYKSYTRGGRTQKRKITRPDATILVSIDDVSSSAFTLESGGIIRFDSAMSGGEIIKWGGTFLVPCAFASDDIEETIHNKSISLVGDVAIEIDEVRE